MNKKYLLLILSAVLLLLAGCSAGGQIMDGDGMVNSYRQISQEEAMKMMEQDDGHVIVDVRRQDEYDSGHIPGAILIPNESIGTTPPEQLPDRNQIILIYCRSGRRSKEAAQKLFDMGYTNIYEFGGINTWPGEIVTEDGEQYSGTSSGEQGSGISSGEQNSGSSSGELTMRLLIGETEVPVSWENNPSVEELKGLLPLNIEMHMHGGFEQVGPIGQDLTSNDVQTTTDFGDIVLYSGDQIVIFYGSNSWAYTRLGHVELTKQEMTDLLSNGDVSISIIAGQ